MGKEYVSVGNFCFRTGLLCMPTKGLDLSGFLLAISVAKNT